MINVNMLQKSIDTLKSSPLWLLLAIFISSFISALTAYLWFPEFLPEILRPYMPITIVVSLIFLACKLADLGIGHLKSNREKLHLDNKDQLILIYAPLMRLLQDIHITEYQSIGAPRLKDRFKNALKEFNSYKRWRAKIKWAWHALSDKQTSFSRNMDQGSFPLVSITALVNMMLTIAPTTLVDLVKNANKQRLKQQSQELITDEKLALYKHIDAQYKRFKSNGK